MNTSIVNIETLRTQFTGYLHEKKMRNTVERDRIFSAICCMTDIFTVDTVLHELENNNFHVCRASVYNTLELLAGAKIIVRHLLSSASVHYELKHLAERRHHIICTGCGSIRVIEQKADKALPARNIPKFTPEYHISYIYGVCSKCKYRNMREQMNTMKKI